MRWQAGFILFMIGIWPRKIMQGELPEGPFIICPNHTSYIDILLLYRIFPRYFVFMGKQELATVPVFNIFFKKMNILVDRNSRMGSVRALWQAGKELDKKRSVVIFPEGTIPYSVPKMKAFKNGPFRLAIEKQLPIVPVTFINNYKLLQIGAFFKQNGRPGIARVVINKAVPTEGMKENDLLTLRNTVYQEIDETITAFSN